MFEVAVICLVITALMAYVNHRGGTKTDSIQVSFEVTNLKKNGTKK